MKVVIPRDHPCTVVLTDKTNDTEVHREDTSAEVLNGCLTRIRICWNSLAVSGGVKWRHPGTGQYFPRGLTVRVETTHPDTGELVEVAI